MLSVLRENAAPMVELLLKHNADPRARSTVDGARAWRGASAICVVRPPRLLLLALAPLTWHMRGAGRTALHNAAEYGDEPAARALLAGGAAVDAKTMGGATPAHLAMLRRGPQAQPIVCLLTFWAADVEAAAAARLALGGPGSRLLGVAGRDNCASGRGGGSRSGAGCSVGGSRGAGCSMGGSSRNGGSIHGIGLSNHPMLKQHGSSAALLLLDAGAQPAVPV